MKKIFVVILIISILFYAKQVDSFTLLDYFDGEYLVYTEEKIADESINLGFCYMTKKMNSASNVKGESIKVYDAEIGNIIKTLKAKIVSTENLESGAVVIYGYSRLIADSVKLDNNLINVQIACYDDYAIIGWPLILGSF